EDAGPETGVRGQHRRRPGDAEGGRLHPGGDGRHLRAAAPVLQGDRRLPADPHRRARRGAEGELTMTRQTWSVRLAAVVLAAAVLGFAPLAMRAQTRAGRGAPPAPGANSFRPLKVLMLGQDQRHHDSAALYQVIAPVFARKGIQITHVNTPAEALVPETLANYDALMLYANHTKIEPEQEKALLDFVAAGKGLVVLHCARRLARAGDAQGGLRRWPCRPQLREPQPGAEVPAALHPRRIDEVHPGAGRVPPRALRQRAADRQADRLLVRRARTSLGDRN